MIDFILKIEFFTPRHFLKREDAKQRNKENIFILDDTVSSSDHDYDDNDYDDTSE